MSLNSRPKKRLSFIIWYGILHTKQITYVLTILKLFLQQYCQTFFEMIAFVWHIIYSYPKVQLNDDVFFSMVNFAFAAMNFDIHLLLCRMETAIRPVLGILMSSVVVKQGRTSLHMYKHLHKLNEMLRRWFILWYKNLTLFICWFVIPSPW